MTNTIALCNIVRLFDTDKQDVGLQMGWNCYAFVLKFFVLSFPLTRTMCAHRETQSRAVQESISKGSTVEIKAHIRWLQKAYNEYTSITISSHGPIYTFVPLY